MLFAKADGDTIHEIKNWRKKQFLLVSIAEVILSTE